MKSRMLSAISTPAGLAFWSACLLVVSLPVSPFLLSLSMWFLVAAAWWHTMATHHLRAGQAGDWLAVLRISFRKLYSKPWPAVLTLLLFVPAVSFFWSDDTAYWLRLVQTRLPFLVLPWAFVNMPQLEARRMAVVLELFVWFIAGICVVVGINFLMHYDAMIEGLGRGNPIPVPRSHVRFSLLVATAIYSGFWLLQQQQWRWDTLARKVLWVCTLFLAFFIHVLSVRGGLLSFYAAAFFLLVRYVWVSRRWLVGLGGLFLLVLALWGATETVPSLKRRIDYMKYDWDRFVRADEGYLYSDAARWISLHAGISVWQQSLWTGVGAGDLLQETKRQTAALFPDYAQEPKLPHNQFIFIMACTGLIGLSLSCIAFFLPLFIVRGWLFQALQMMALASFLIECTLENAIGVAWFLFYSFWFSLCKPKNPTDNIS